ncbi:hypothetical protein CC1G_15835 [Coprinopsis cinerea okayama7|uniref:Uncharacterized protein n=1 Tax=Coprinopsis cinerea (strain Okayama-7 / 130 / ATCC MYA-4618 / FGSC 9003) TaxID=240176 RepID=D6RR39_COPC7|nr:hypothetical protein CC1G_15835 [Coprinopsis cinerea okayama7\|eukprot:XP_002910019.1 hypothetical protein CC1G_15835 [Coprinopsis cinerea okayama7\
MTKRFGKHVCRVVVCINSKDFNVSFFNTFANVVIANINVFDTTFLNGIGADKDGSIVVRVRNTMHMSPLFHLRVQGCPIMYERFMYPYTDILLFSDLGYIK